MNLTNEIGFVKSAKFCKNHGGTLTLQNPNLDIFVHLSCYVLVLILCFFFKKEETNKEKKKKKREIGELIG